VAGVTEVPATGFEKLTSTWVCTGTPVAPAAGVTRTTRGAEWWRPSAPGAGARGPAVHPTSIRLRPALAQAVATLARAERRSSSQMLALLLEQGVQARGWLCPHCHEPASDMAPAGCPAHLL
jgi:hypothetical protein